MITPITPLLDVFAYDRGDNTLPAFTASTPDNVANQQTGFPLLQAEDLSNPDALPVKEEQVNGVLQYYTSILYQLGKGNLFTFDSTLSDAIGGYSKGAMLWSQVLNSFQVSLVDNNTANFVTTPAYLNDNVNWIAPTLYGTPVVCCGRLTDTSNNPLGSNSSSGSSVLYFTPYKGSAITLYKSGQWATQPFSEVAITISTGGVSTGVLAANQVYYVYAYSTGATTINLEFQEWVSGEPTTTYTNGVVVKNGDPTRLLIGIVCSPDGLKVYNYDYERYITNLFYNPINKPLYCHYAGADYDISNLTFRSAAGVTTLGVSSVAALFCSYLNSIAVSNSQNSEVLTPAGENPQIAIGVNSTTTAASVYLTCIATSGLAGFYGTATVNDILTNLTGSCTFYRLERLGNGASATMISEENKMTIPSYPC